MRGGGEDENMKRVAKDAQGTSGGRCVVEERPFRNSNARSFAASPLVVATVLLLVAAGRADGQQAQPEVRSETVKVVIRGAGCAAINLATYRDFLGYKVSVKIDSYEEPLFGIDAPPCGEDVVRVSKPYLHLTAPEGAVDAPWRGDLIAKAGSVWDGNASQYSVPRCEEAEMNSLQTAFLSLATFSDQETYQGQTCEYGTTAMHVHHQCPGTITVAITLSLRDVEGVGCTIYSHALYLRDHWRSLQIPLAVFSVMWIGSLVLCCAPLSCRPGACCGMLGAASSRLAPPETLREKAAVARLQNQGGHNRALVVNLVCAGILWVQSEIWSPTLDLPEGISIPHILRQATFLSYLQPIIEKHASEQMGLVIKWAEIAAASMLVGYLMYGALLVNSAPFDSRRYRFTAVFSGVLMLALDVLLVGLIGVAHLEVAPFWRYKWENCYLFGALYIHLLIANICMAMVLVGRSGANPKGYMRIRRSKVAPNSLPVRGKAHQDPKPGPWSAAGLWERVKCAYAEEPGFQYPPFVLAILVAAAHVLLFTFLQSTGRIHQASVCLADVESCAMDRQANLLFVLPVNQLIEQVKPQSSVEERRAAMFASYRLYSATQETQSSLEGLLGGVCTQRMSRAMQEVAGGGSAGGSLAAEAEALQELCRVNVEESLGKVTDAVSEVLDRQGPAEEQLVMIAAAGMQQQVPGAQGLSTLTRLQKLQQAGERLLEEAIEAEESAERQLGNFAPALRAAGFLGYLLGVFMGTWGLCNTLAAYKRISKLWARHRGLSRLVGHDRATELQPSPGTLAVIRDITNVNLVYSVFFMGMVVSTAIVQLHIFGMLITATGMLLGYHPWWKWLIGFIGRFWGVLLAFVVVTILNYPVMILLVGRRVATPSQIKSHNGWVMFYLVCSFTQVPYTLLLALFRVVKLVASTLFGAMARLDVNLFTMFRFLDDGYNCFVAVVCMEHALRAKEVWGWALVRRTIRTQRFYDYKRQMVQCDKDLECNGGT